MGMFNSVYARCPNCGGDLEWQSKADDCILAIYGLEAVPLSIAADIHEETISCSCGKTYKIELDGEMPPRIVAMKLTNLAEGIGG